jgi:16S rRNA U516 pseudouridylate synthase RsuA-like enzyme
MTSSLGASFASLAGRVAVAVGRRRGAGPADGGGCIRAALAPPRRWLCAAAAANGGESSSSSEPFEGFAPETPRHQNTPKRVGPRPQKKTFTGEHALSPAARKRLASEGVRLGKALAQLGVASRRASEDLIFAGRVAVNGVVVTAPQHHVVLADDVVAVDGKVIQGGVEETREHLYFLLNKPKGYICANAKSPNKPPGKGERGGGASGKLVMDLFDEWKAAWRKKHPKRLPPRLFTVGRLDVNTTGMLLVTTDGQWCQRVAHPKSEVVKSYVLTASARPTKAQIRAMAAGAEVDGAFVKPVNVRSMVRSVHWSPCDRVRAVNADP